MPTYRDLGLDIDDPPDCPLVVTPMFGGVPTYSYAVTHKDDLSMMLMCCAAEENANLKTGQFPAPFFFHRAAVLAAKAGDRKVERAVCIRFRDAVRRSKKAMKSGGYKAADTSVGPRGKAVLARLKKIDAQRLAKQKLEPNMQPAK